MDSLVEGVSDEVLILAILTALTAIIWLCYMIAKTNRRPLLNIDRSAPNIHPDSEEIVNSTRQNISSNRPSRQRDADSTCPVCLGSIVYGLETNCGHLFCGQCIIAYWRTGRWLGAVACPICRQTVTILMLSFTNEELRQENDPVKNELLDEVYSYNRRYSGQPRTVWEHMRDVPTLLRHAISDLFSLEGMALMFRLRVALCMLLALLYLLSPFDIIPEMAVGVLGYFDDLFIIVIVATYIAGMYRTFLSRQAEHHAHTD